MVRPTTILLSILSIFFLFDPVLCIAQPDSNTIQNLHLKIRNIQPHGTIYYADRIENRFLKPIRSEITKGTIKRQFRTGTVAISLTKKEIDFLKTAIAKYRKPYWPDNLFPDSKRMSSKTIAPYVDSLRISLVDSLRRNVNRDSSRFNYRDLYWSFFFSEPIFIRDKTIFLQFFLYYSMSSGQYDWSFYRKENGKWVKWIPVEWGAW